MTDLRSRLRDIERIEPPELWPEIVGREPTPRAGSRGRGRVLLAAVVAVVVVAAGVLLPLTLLKLGSQSRPVGPPPSVSPSPGIRGNQGLVLGTRGPVIRLISGDGVLFVVYQTGPASSRYVLEVVARIDPRTGNVVRSQLFVHVEDVQLAAGWLWVSGEKLTGAWSLFRLDARTLEVRDTVALPGAGALAASDAGLWVGDGDRLDLVDAAGRIIRVQKADGEVGALAVDPTGRFLYVATSVSAEDITPRSISQRDASTGAVVAKVRALPAVAVTALSGTTDGVWVSYATGLLGQVVFLPAGDLRQVAEFTPRPGEGGTNTIHANVGSGVLWVADDMVGSLWCADPATGALRASLKRPAPADGYGMSDMVPVGSDVYIGTGHGVYRLAPDLRCGVSS
jgi:outer membrane protein assembly factor BamB